MNMRRSCRTALLSAMALVASAALLVTGGVVTASAAEPEPSAWWGITSQARPTYLKPGQEEGVARRNEVQDIAVSATSGYWWLEDSATKQKSSVLSYDATHQEVQMALEGLYGTRNVSVPEGQGDESGSNPYRVVFEGALAHTPVAPIVAESFNIPLYCSFAHLCPLKGGEETVTVTEVARGYGGKSSGQTVAVTITNLGDAPVTGQHSPVVISDTLPDGIQGYEVQAFTKSRRETIALSCRLEKTATGQSKASCEYGGSLEPYDLIEMFVFVNTNGDARSASNEVVVNGGQTGECAEVTSGLGKFNDALCLTQSQLGLRDFEVLPVSGTSVPEASLRRSLIVSNEPTPFGIEQYEVRPEAAGGAAFTQAGGHPFQLTTTLVMNSGAETAREGAGVGRAFDLAQPAMVKDLTFRLPRGFVGNPTAFPQCSDRQFNSHPHGQGGGTECPGATVVGVAVVEIHEPEILGTVGGSVPLFNLVPARGEPARFGFEIDAVPVIFDTSVRTGGDYGVTVSTRNISQSAGFVFGQVTFWGTPGATAHRLSRGTACVMTERVAQADECANASDAQGEPFLIMPTTCSSGSLVSEVEGDSWTAFKVAPQTAEPQKDPFPTMTACNGLNFEPSIKTAPDYEEASRASGLSVDVHVPQEADLNPNGVAESEVKQIEVALPKGVTLNPGGAGGLQACTGNPADAPGSPGNEIGFKGANSEAVGGLEYTPSFPSCPKQSKIATAEIHTPLLPNPLKGAVYLATPAPFGELNANPFNSLIAMYLVAEDRVSGTLVKLPMHVYLCEAAGETVAKTVCEAAGQVVTTVENPQLPFEDAELHFFGGGRAPLATPGLCGAYTTKALFTPWSGNEPVTSTSTFNITSGPNGSPCPSNPKPFDPEFNTDTTNINAGSYSELRTTMGHPDVDQALGALKLTLPPGLMGSLSGVKLCPEPQANEGTCGPESLIGHTVVTAGLGSTPAVVARPGDVYITGPFNGHGACRVGEAGCAPFGLSIANPAETGPFDLEKATKCDCVVVRAKIEVDPRTAQLTITTDPSGTPGAIPTMLRGIPLDLQHVTVQIDRQNFTFNPTNCNPLKIEGSLSGAEGAVSPISEHFQVANCATLPFKPGFSALTHGKHTRRGGEYLHVLVTSSHGQADIARVHVELPKALPSRLSTLQKACGEDQFAKNPAGCPAASIVGRAIVHTPVLPVPLEGPAYFVSHGGKKFPELVMVLQGYGVTVELAGETFISKKGITSSSFNSVPDVPFNRFELTLPTGSNSALAGNGNLCYRTLIRRVRTKVGGRTVYRTRRLRKRRTLLMPTKITGQNGAVIEQNTKVALQGCGGKRKARKAAHGHGGHYRRNRR